MAPFAGNPDLACGFALDLADRASCFWMPLCGAQITGKQ
jgi:predicted RNA-binding Zn-ribbon protein involved in translation (DUF1610 family)